MAGVGFFVVVEGPEGAGKSTLVRALVERMAWAGVAPVAVREPGGTPAAEALRAELLNDERRWTPEAELLYIAAARADVVAKVIRPALEAGRVVVSDRFDLSTRAYQIAGRGLPMEQAGWVNRAATGGLVPDLTIVIDVPDGVGRQRQLSNGKVGDRLDRETTDFHQRVADFYRRADGPGLHHLDGAVAPEQLFERAWSVVSSARPDLFVMER
ncbi:MAG: dTMP kinase [Gemmatimonadales bacterium]